MADNSKFAEILEIIEPFLQNEGLTVMSNLTKCKWLGKMIKAQRTPAWPCPLTTEFPPKKIADVLVANYLRMSESVYRVLHIPTFKRDYEAIMISNDPDMASVVLLKLVMAIGSTVYDDKFSMRATAIRWVHEAQTWISEPEFKARLGIQFLQIQILLLIARGIVGVEGTLVWVSTGQLIRFAIYMGLNRDPEILPKASCYSSEMRRRLWNTILELDLQASMESGGPPFNSLNEFNTLPPGNFDDDAITVENPTPEPEDMFTQTSIALALRKTFPLRTHIAKMLNGMAVHAGYEETLRLDSELRASYKGICRQLQGYKTDFGREKPSDFETRMVDFLIRRFLTALHMPFFGSSVKDAQYAYSRKVVIESSLKTWCTIFPSSSAMISLPGSKNTSSKSDDISRLALCGTGSFRMVSMQAAFLIAVELKTQVQEDPSPGPMFLRTDLYSILQDGKRWSLRCIEAGETNIKGYLFMCLVCTQIESLMRGIPREELPLVILKSAEEAEADCLRILEGNIDAGTSDPYQSMKMPVDPLSEIMGDWSLMVSFVSMKIKLK